MYPVSHALFHFICITHQLNDNSANVSVFTQYKVDVCLIFNVNHLPFRGMSDVIKCLLNLSVLLLNLSVFCHLYGGVKYVCYQQGACHGNITSINIT